MKGEPWETPDTFEELVLDDTTTVEEIEKKLSHISEFPCVCINRTMYFNTLAGSVVPKYVKWLVTTNLLIGLPTDEKDKNGFKTRFSSRARKAVITAFPADMRDRRMIKKGFYKVYKYKDGFAIKRYEPIHE